MPPTDEDTVKDNALAPKRARGDEGEVEQHPIPDQIKILDRAAARTQLRSTGIIRFLRLRMPGADGTT